MRDIKKTNNILLGCYIAIIVGYLFVKPFVGVAYSSQSTYFSKVLYCINLVPFNYNPNVGVQILIDNAIIKFIMLSPIAYFYFVYSKNQSFLQFLCLIITFGFVYELIQVLCLKGYFDITDIIYYLFGSGFFYIVLRIGKDVLIMKH